MRRPGKVKLISEVLSFFFCLMRLHLPQVKVQVFKWLLFELDYTETSWLGTEHHNTEVVGM